MIKIKAASKTETEKLFSDLNKPSLHALSYALRHPDTWPEGFVWDYSTCNHCAMGLAHALWKQNVPEVTRFTGASVMARSFALPFEDARFIFLGLDGQYGADFIPFQDVKTPGGWFRRATTERIPDWDAVTPEIIADQIDAYLARAE